MAFESSFTIYIVNCFAPRGCRVTESAISRNLIEYIYLFVTLGIISFSLTEEGSDTLHKRRLLEDLKGISPGSVWCGI